MYVLDFMNNHKNWEEVLSKEPYNLKVSRDGDYIMISYRADAYDFSDPLIRECRGVIFYKNEDGKYECVCRPFDKFMNYGTPFAAEIDWETAVATEKIDGNLIKLWYHNDKWHISTNKTIDAFKVKVGGFNISFGDYFIGCFDYDELIKKLPRNCDYTCMFEVVGPENRVIIKYPEKAVYFLAARNNKTGDFYKPHLIDCWLFSTVGIKFPNNYSASDLESYIELVEKFKDDKEGIVVRDACGNMLKIKTSEYLKKHHAYNNGVITPKRALALIREGLMDEIISLVPDFKDYIIDTYNRYCEYRDYLGVIEEEINKWKLDANNHQNGDIKKNFVFNYIKLKDFKNPSDAGFAFSYYDEKVNKDSYLADMPIDKLAEILYIKGKK